MALRPVSRLTNVLLWALAALVMLSAIVYQRRTGPTHPKRGTFTVGGATLPYRLLRSGDSFQDARIAVPDPGGRTAGTLLYRRFKTADPFTTLPLRAETRDGRRELAAYLPAQPAAGKLEYLIRLEGPTGTLGLPTDGEAVVIRFKDRVPTPLLIAHVALMFVGVLIGVRAGLAALHGCADMAAHAWATLLCLTAGGLVLGPFVQKYAFGAFWTGFPFGGDLTDNKTLLMWGAWVLACAVLRLGRAGLARMAVTLAFLGMLVVYVIPHSARGSELDYAKLDQGVAAAEAIRTGR
ncbi:hypothetical protein [Mesoterricola sediminis]|uniref:Uncharacterized protein n=1 Tax=Mesoterricola sediminis TaxID=2927980 RepID=A0AA48GVP4_9BACT|nr:hypothetical protein [Mesoterricola sediminis]BDU77129.1 hypothetical protein METESE_20870 [Mesoterricola sediminis]